MILPIWVHSAPILIRVWSRPLRSVEGLTDYASAFRYPDAPYEPETPGASDALAIVSGLCEEVRRRIETPLPA